MSISSFGFQLGTPLKTLGYLLLTAGSILLSCSSPRRMFGLLRRIFLAVALHLPRLRNINARYRTHRHELSAGTVRKREEALRLTLL